MKKTLAYAFVVLFGTGVFVACSDKNNAENAESAETVEQEVTEDLQDGTPVEVDVESAQVDTLANGAQQVQTEVTMTPEQAAE